MVSMAEPEEPIRRRVAFKVIRFGTDTRQVVARFKAQRLECARLCVGVESPNSAPSATRGSSLCRPLSQLSLFPPVRLRMDACGLSPKALPPLSIFVSLACFAVKNFTENLEANRPEISPLLNEGPKPAFQNRNLL